MEHWTWVVDGIEVEGRETASRKSEGESSLDSSSDREAERAISKLCPVGRVDLEGRARGGIPRQPARDN